MALAVNCNQMRKGQSKGRKAMAEAGVPASDRKNLRSLEKPPVPGAGSRCSGAVSGSSSGESKFGELPHDVKIVRSVNEHLETAHAELHNVNELRPTNSDLQDTEKKLRMEEKYQTLFESIDEGFCVVEVLFDDANNPIDYRFL